MIIPQYSRLSHHTVTDGGTFSVPGQEDFTISGSGSWTPYDLALSEIGVDELNEKAFIRIGSNIKQFSFGGSGVTGSLSSVLSIGNTTGGNDIIMSNGDFIVSPDSSNSFGIDNLGSYLDVDLQGGDRITIGQNSGFDGIVINNNDVLINGFRFSYATASTSDDTQTTIISYSLSAPDKMGWYEAYVTGIKSDGSEGYFSKINSAIRNDSGTLFQIGSVDLVEKTDFSTATSTIDFSGTSVRVRITGEIATNINWTCRLKHSRII